MFQLVFSCFVAIICSRYFNFIITVLELLFVFVVALLHVHGVSTATIYCCRSSSGVVAISCLWCFNVFILMLQRGEGEESCWGASKAEGKQVLCVPGSEAGPEELPAHVWGEWGQRWFEGRAFSSHARRAGAGWVRTSHAGQD